MSNEKGFQIILFAPDISMFPPIKSIGDIIYIYNLKVVSHGFNLQGKKNDYRDKNTSFSVFGGEEDDLLEPASYNTKPTLQNSNDNLLFYCFPLVDFLKKNSSLILEKTDGKGYTVHLDSISSDLANQDVFGYVEFVKKMDNGLYHFWIWDGTMIDDFSG